MKLIFYQLRRRLWMIPVMAGVYLALFLISRVANFTGFIDNLETMPSLVTVLVSTFVLNNKTENEFAKCYGTKLYKLGLSQYLSNSVYVIAVAVCVNCIFWLINNTAALSDEKIWISMFVTFFFFCSFGFLMQAAFMNSYVSLIGVLVLYSPMFTMHINLEKGALPVENARYDVWITAFLYDKRFGISSEVWWLNRSLYFAAGVALLIAAVVILTIKNKYKNKRRQIWSSLSKT